MWIKTTLTKPGNLLICARLCCKNKSFSSDCIIMDEVNILVKNFYKRKQKIIYLHLTRKRNRILTPDEEVAMIFSSNAEDGPTTSKRARLISNSLASGSQDEHCEFRPNETRSMGHRRQIWDDSSDSDSPTSNDAKGLLLNLNL